MVEPLDERDVTRALHPTPNSCGTPTRPREKTIFQWSVRELLFCVCVKNQGEGKASAAVVCLFFFLTHVALGVGVANSSPTASCLLLVTFWCLRKIFWVVL